MFSLFFLILTHTATAATDWQALLREGGAAQVVFGAQLGGSEPFLLRENEEFAPASTAKLFTAGAVLASLGPDYRYPTTLRWRETSSGVAARLTLVGSGDPSWGLSERGEGERDRLDRIAAALKAAGVREVRGDVAITASDPRWDSVRIPDGWKDSDTAGCDGALAQAFNLSLNCATYLVHSPTSGAWAAAGLDYPVRLFLRPAGATSLSARFTGTGFVIEGSWKRGSQPESLRLPVYDTRGWVKNLFRAALASQGIQLTPGSAADGTARDLVIYSPPLADLLKPFLKNSINMMGDAFLKALSADAAAPAGGDPSLLTPALARLEAFLREYGDERGFALHDGSGLSRTSRVAPAFVFGYLERISQAKWFPALYAALPIAGVDGTLRERMKGTPAQGRLRAKTGTLDGVYNLAGYVPVRAGYVPFVLYARTGAGPAAPAKAAEDRVGARLAALNTDPSASLEPAEPYPFVPEHAGADAP